MDLRSDEASGRAEREGANDGEEINRVSFESERTRQRTPFDESTLERGHVSTMETAGAEQTMAYHSLQVN